MGTEKVQDRRRSVGRAEESVSIDLYLVRRYFSNSDSGVGELKWRLMS